MMNSTNEMDIGRCALTLALTETMQEESEMKRALKEKGFQCGIAEVGGNTRKDFQSKFIRTIVGTALSNGVIEKVSHEIHALITAAGDAQNGIIFNGTSESNIAVKIAIVRNKHWIAVAIFGESAFHPLTGHARCGLGVMNI